MATKQEIIEGLELTIAQAKRTTALYAEGEWDWKRASGWTPREVYSHLASVAAMVPGFSQAMAAAGEEKDLIDGLDVNSMNAQAVGSMSPMTPEQVMQAFEANYRKLIDFVKAAPDDQWSARRRFASDAMPVSDIVGTSVMLHGLHHVYEAASRVAG